MNNSVISPILGENQCLALIEVTVKSQAKFTEYVVGHLPSIAQYGGKIIFEGFDKISYEGEAKSYHFLVIQQWENQEIFEKWWNSPEYKPWKEVRHEGAEVSLTLVKQRGNH